jgi:hypothetical protein
MTPPAEARLFLDALFADPLEADRAINWRARRVLFPGPLETDP